MNRDLGFVHTVKREIHRIVSRPIYIFGMIFVPLFVAFFLLDFLGAGLPSRIPCAVVDLDKTEMSRELTRTLGTMQNCDVQYNVDSYTEAMKLVREQKVYGFFVIPENFANDALSLKKPEITLYSNYVFFIPGTLLYKGMLTTATLAKASLMSGVLAGVEIPEAEVRNMMMPIDTETHPLNNPWLSYNIYLTNSFAPCLLALMILLMTSYSIGMEIKHGTSQDWIKNAHGSMLIALLGKMIPHTIVFFVVGCMIDAMLYGYAGFPMNCSIWQILLTMLLFVVACQSFALFVFMLLPNLRLALSVCSLVGILSFSIAGFSYPAEQMYGAVEIFTWIIPIRYYFMIYIDQVLNGIDLYYSRYYYAALFVFMLLPFTLWRRLKHRCENPVYVP